MQSQLVKHIIQPRNCKRKELLFVLFNHTYAHFRPSKSVKKKSTRRAVPQKSVPHNFHRAGRYFNINSRLGKYKEHLIKMITFFSIKSEILLYSCGKLKKFLNVICRYVYWKRCSFSFPSWLKDGNNSAGWLKGTPFFQKKFKKVYFFEINTM